MEERYCILEGSTKRFTDSLVKGKRGVEFAPIPLNSRRNQFKLPFFHLASGSEPHGRKHESRSLVRTEPTGRR